MSLVVAAAIIGSVALLVVLFLVWRIDRRVSRAYRSWVEEHTYTTDELEGE